MSKLPTIWDIEPHTRAKHQILEEYLKAWFPILSKRSSRIVYLDGFAGPGVYSKGEEGSPIISIRIAHEHFLRDKLGEIIFLFIEKDEKRANKLSEVLKETFPDLPMKFRYEVVKSEFATELEKNLDALEKGAKPPPIFAFIDPFGFSGFPMSLISRLLGYDKCEVLITFMEGFANRFTELHQNVIDDLFGTYKWREINKIDDPDGRRNFILQLYQNQLIQAANAKFVKTFEMIGKKNQLIYHLVFATRHLRGLEVMKEAMFKVDRRVTYRFSDRTDPKQTFILDYGNEENWVSEASKLVYTEFRGQRVSVEEIHEFVIVDTPYIFKKKILQHLESSKPPRIAQVDGRTRPLTYLDGCEIIFSK